MTKSIVPENNRQIIAMSGSSYPSVTAGGQAFLKYIAAATDKAVPQILFVGGARGNSNTINLWFYQTLMGIPCQLTSVNFFGRVPNNLADLVMAPDLVFIAGGMEIASMAMWREYKFDQALKDAWERGVVLSGVSFGGMVWFEKFLCNTYSSGYSPLDGLGLVEGSMQAHFDSQPVGAAVFRRLMGSSLPAGYAVPEQCGLHVIGRNQVKALTTDKNVACSKIALSGPSITQTPVPTTLL